MDTEKVIEILRENRRLLAQFHVCSLSVFGSVVRGEAGPDSDIDILVEFEPDAHIGLFALPDCSVTSRKFLGEMSIWPHRKRFTKR